MNKCLVFLSYTFAGIATHISLQVFHHEGTKAQRITKNYFYDEVTKGAKTRFLSYIRHEGYGGTMAKRLVKIVYSIVPL